MNSLDLQDHFFNYHWEVEEALRKIDKDQFNLAYYLLQDVIKPWTRSRIFVCGNGGSASIAEHFTCDHSKGIRTDTDRWPCTVSLSSNMATITAIANDLAYDQIFSKQLEYHNMTGEDLLVVISSSGKSPNIINALKYAIQQNAKVISFVGFDGGDVKKIRDDRIGPINHSIIHALLHARSSNYGVVEDCHQIIMHALAQALRKEYAQTS